MFTVDDSLSPEDGNTGNSQNAVHIKGLPQTKTVGNIQYNYRYNESAIVAHLQRFAAYEADADFYVLNAERTTLIEQNPL
jgi:hypothetical protein